MSMLKYLQFKPNKIEERFFNSILYTGTSTGASSTNASSSSSSASSSASSSQQLQGTGQQSSALPGFAFLDERVKIFKSSTKGYGLRSATFVPARTKVIIVPKPVWEPYSAKMIVSQAKESNPEFVNSLRQMASSIFPNNVEQANVMENSLCMGLDIMLQAIDNDGAGSSDYISLLSGSSHPFNFDTLPHPLLMDDKYLRLIKGTQAFNQISLRQRMYRGIAARVFPEEHHKQIALVWSIGVILSRALSGANRPFTLVPLLDLANHSGDLARQNIEHDFNLDKQEFSVSTTRDVQPNEELFLTYGLQRDSTQLLTIYGFVDGSAVHNQNDRIRLQLDYNSSVGGQQNSSNTSNSTSSNSNRMLDEDYSISNKTLYKWKLQNLVSLMQNPAVSIPSLKVYQALSKEIGTKLEKLDNSQVNDSNNNSSSNNSKMVIELVTNDWVLGRCGVDRSVALGDSLLTQQETIALAKKLKLILQHSSDSNRNSDSNSNSDSSSSSGGSGSSVDITNLDLADLIGLEAIICDCMIGKSGWVQVLKDADVPDHPSNINFICHLFVKLFNHYFGPNLLIPLRLASLTRRDLSNKLGESYCAEDLEELSLAEVFAKTTEMAVIRDIVRDIDRQIGAFIQTSKGQLPAPEDQDAHGAINKLIHEYLSCTTKKQLDSLDTKYVLASPSSSSSSPSPSSPSSTHNGDSAVLVDPYLYWSKYIAPIVVGRELGALWSLRSHLEIYEFAVDHISESKEEK